MKDHALPEFLAWVVGLFRFSEESELKFLRQCDAVAVVVHEPRLTVPLQLASRRDVALLGLAHGPTLMGPSGCGPALACCCSSKAASSARSLLSCVDAW
eukprot:13147001-Heterocapsa_arctica.AAC.1